MGLVRGTAILAYRSGKQICAKAFNACKNHPKATKKIAASVAGLGVAYISTNYIGPQQFGLRQSFFSAGKATLPPGFYANLPWPLQYTHRYEAGTQTIEFNAGSGRFLPFWSSTKDQNILTATVAINYQVVPDPEKLKFHLYDMDGWMMQDGYWLLTRMANDSANAVLGKSTIAETLSNPQDFVDQLRTDLAARLEQNNVPVNVESIELKSFNTTLPVTVTDNRISKAPAEAKDTAPAP
jgi:regulator of protease activity HflC (stomatin/prohibitin superfamily)